MHWDQLRRVADRAQRDLSETSRGADRMQNTDKGEGLSQGWASHAMGRRGRTTCTDNRRV